MLKVNNHIKYSLVAAIAALAAMGELYRLKSLLNEGLDQGLTIDELNSAFSYMVRFIGQPRALNGLNVLKQICLQKLPNSSELIEQQIKQIDTLYLNANNSQLAQQNLLAIKLGALAVDDNFTSQLHEHLALCLDSHFAVTQINSMINILAIKADIDVAMRANKVFAKLLAHA
ncbi:carboxymuconolactone decarboxylase family protein [Pseudoalteromonas prydzensis]|uniref:carboxymuconolactone decarboxylase family protein n=1 Tax=Pseudoalteromonas prydzensis TaxID=182141 RepID=UPI0024BC09E3|nr:carboxymuconolactone decarboxylase family protein [Pseudoalteromonas prydzensis]